MTEKPAGDPQIAGNPQPGKVGDSTEPSFLEQASAPQAPAQPGNPTPETAADANAPPQLPSWSNMLTKELRSDQRFSSYAQKYKSMDEIVKSAIEMEAKQGSMITIPGENATQEEVRAYLEKVGVPKTPDEYQFDTANGLFKVEEVAALKSWAHGLNLTKQQAGEFFKNLAEQTKKSVDDYQASIALKDEQDTQAVTQQLQKEWGPAYAENYETVKRGIAAYDQGGKLLQKLSAAGLGSDADVVKLFWNLGRATREDNAASLKPGQQGAAKRPEDILYPDG